MTLQEASEALQKFEAACEAARARAKAEKTVERA
jgi:hypothetical protein